MKGSYILLIQLPEEQTITIGSLKAIGSSDCKCHSHLFFAADEMETTILAILNLLDTRPRLTRARL